jgi:signal transduction histidine kinase
MDEKFNELEMQLSPDSNLLDKVKSINQAKKELEAAFDSLSDIVLLLDFNGKIIRGNRVVEDWNLRNVSELDGLPFHKLFHPYCHDDECHINTNWTFARERISENQSYEYQFNDPILGRYLLIQFRPISSQIVETPRMNNIFLVATFRDITASKQAEIELDQTTEELKTIFQALPEQYIRLNRNGDILDIKTSRDSSTSLFPPNTIGKNIRTIVAPSIQEKFYKAINDVQTTNSPVRLEYSLVQRNNTQFYEARFLPLSDDQILMINQDISEKKELETLAESVDMMEKLNYIFSAIRHEIGNPVNSIKVTVSVLKKNIGKFPDEKVLEYTDRVLSEINRIEYLLKSFKNFVMFEEMELENIAINKFLTDYFSLLNENFKEKGIKLSLELSPDAHTVCADPKGLYQVLLNIINNAVDALKEKNDKWLKISTNKNNGKIRITIIDNGKGLSEEQSRNLFQPFFTTKAEGTGLGLVLVKKILTRMQGEINIESAINIGTTVNISLQEGKCENL